MALLESINVPIGIQAPNFELEATDGKTYSLSTFKDKKGLALIFMCNHCPYVHAILDELVKLQSDFGEKGVQIVGINPNTANPEYFDDETMEKMKELSLSRGFDFPYLEDKDQGVAKAYQAQCTPDIFLYDTDRKLYYHGRVDDGELEAAIEALLNDRGVPEDQHPSRGCSIKWV